MREFEGEREGSMITLYCTYEVIKSVHFNKYLRQKMLTKL